MPSNQIVGQSIELKIKLIDEISKEPVANAHLFMENTTFGNVSDNNGLVHLTIPENIKEDLFVSHVAYQTRIIKHSYIKKNLEETIIELTPNAFEIEALTISAKRSKKRNKQFKIFRKAFLGNDNISKNCTILNPEVIRFKEEKNKLIATATDLIIIDNPRLAYEIYYLLNMLEVSSDGSSKYLGQALFVDKSTNENQEEILKHRMETYFKSPKYFFKSLIDNKLQERGFEAELMSYEEGRFHPFKAFSRDSLLNGPSSHGKYTLEFDEFLKVYNKNSRIVSFDPRGVRQGGLESQRFSTATRDRKEVISYDFSYIYKISPYVILNEFGNVLNSSDIKEYGSWASQKVAHQLPFDFGNSYEEAIMNEGLTNPDNNQLSSQEKFTMIRSLLYERDPVKRNITFEKLSNYWEDGFAAPLIEIIRLSTDQELLQKINEILWDKFEHENQEDYYDWIQWLWTKNLPEEDYYFDIKSELYKHLDPLFERYFRERHDQSSINLGEVLWGGVRQDGIPPLRNPEMIDAAKADYLDDKDIVFGAYINGVAKAYPKRILGWHEFFTDNFKENKIAGVYCT
ncbi:MAG: DUF3179 domain-containing protein, partial [Bacteroidia bacterium]|nr:DUF3179 domain-containing protein [Bacteroidia bacterium]